jgi:glucose-1-phosphatase
MTVRAVVFDFGNVVGFFSHRKATERLAPLAGVDADAFHAFVFGGRLEDDYESGRLTTAAFVEAVRGGCRLGCTDEAFAEAYGDIFWPNPGVCELLPALARRHTLLLLSNTNELHARRFRAQFADVLCHFGHLVLSHEVGARKPHPGIFRHAERLAGCHPGEMLFVDDLPANVEGARACGWHGIVYTGPEDLRRELAAHGVEVSGEGDKSEARNPKSKTNPKPQ